MQVIIICIVVFGRLVLNKTPGWGEPGALMFMVWFSLMSAALGVVENKHLQITFTDLFLPPVLIRIFDIFSLFIILIFSLFMIVYGFKMTELATLNIMAGLGIKGSWLFASIPAAGVALFLAAVERIIKELWKKK